MKPKHLIIPNSADQSFSIRKDMIPNINNRWHFHAEVELICFHKGSGTQFVGDNIKRFGPGDIVLVGSQLPHYWRYDRVHFSTETEQENEPYSTVIHFYESFLGERLLFLPEFKAVKNLLEKARRGILIKGNQAKLLRQKIEEIYQLTGAQKVIALLQCLVDISSYPQPAMLASMGFKYDLRESENERLNSIYNFTLNNFKRKIMLEEVSEVADLAPNSFCRYFKARTGKTFSKFLIDIRIGYACKLILENKMDVKQICFESGFHNFSCFHKNFRLNTGKTPKSYQEAHLHHNS